METVAISKFKATCLAVLQRVKRSGRPVLITRFGEPVAEVVPVRPAARSEAWIGSMKGRGDTAGDLTKPALEPRAWKALRG